MRKLALVVAVLSVLTLGAASVDAAGCCKAKADSGCPRAERVEKKECKSEKKECRAEGEKQCPQKEECQKACPKAPGK